MAGEPDYYLDVEGIEDGDPPASVRAPGGRDWIGIQFECCGTYARIYKNAAGTAYRGRCPRCLALVEVGIGPDGTDRRLFRAR